MLGVILLCLFLLILMILFLSISICIVYDGDIAVYTKVLFVKIKVFPRDSKPDLKDFSAKGIDKKIKKDKAQLAKLNSKEEKKKNESSPKKKTQIIDTLKLIARILSAVKKTFFKHLRVRVADLNLIIATDDAAKTALEYGVAVQGVQYIVSILESITNFNVSKKGNIRVDCDFTSESSKLDLDIALTLRIWQALDVLLRAGLAFVASSANKKKDN